MLIVVITSSISFVIMTNSSSFIKKETNKVITSMAEDKVIADVATTIQNAILDNLTSIQKMVIILNIIVFVISIAITYYVSHKLTDPIVNAANHAETISKLDISYDVPKKHLNWKNESGKLARAFDALSKNLRDVIREITNSADQVASASEELTATSEQSATVLEEMTKTISEIADGAEEQALSTQEGTDNASELGEEIRHNVELTRDLKKK